jgi:hypothetical protein
MATNGDVSTKAPLCSEMATLFDSQSDIALSPPLGTPRMHARLASHTIANPCTCLASGRTLQWLERVRLHIRPLKPRGLIDIWADTRIQAGSLWREEIRQALTPARVVFLLTSLITDDSQPLRCNCQATLSAVHERAWPTLDRHALKCASQATK